jgi:hypothetical protein
MPIASLIRWFAPLVGGLTTATFLCIHASLRPGGSYGLVDAFLVWSVRDVLLAYGLALPCLLIARRLGLRGIVVSWFVAASAGLPMGYVLANPLQYAWTPEEQDFVHGPYWGIMLAYASLFGLSGVLFSMCERLRRARDVPANSVA